MYASGAVPVAARIAVVASIEVADERARSARTGYTVKGIERVNDTHERCEQHGLGCPHALYSGVFECLPALVVTCVG